MGLALPTRRARGIRPEEEEAPPYVAALLLVQARVRARTFAVTVLGLPIALYGLFALVMRLALPRGPLEPLLRGL